MISVEFLIKSNLIAIDADGLCNPGEECGCGIDELAPCQHLNLVHCVAAKFHIPEKDSPEYENFPDGYYKAVEM